MKGTDRLRPAAGQIEVITGGMFSGKSEELLRRLRRALIARQRVQVFQPRADSRAEPERIVTRDNRALEALTVASSQELQERLELGVEVVGIDEAQFFDAGLVPLVTRLADLGLRVVVAGLDQDYLRRAFGPMPELLALAEYVDKMHAVCVRCGSPAHYSQRIAGGDEQLQVGDVESYEARCRRCYEPFAVHSAKLPDDNRQPMAGAPTPLGASLNATETGPGDRREGEDNSGERGSGDSPGRGARLFNRVPERGRAR